MRDPEIVPYLVWRSGRPRWSPGPKLRAAGASGRDLKDADGRWLPLREAAAEAKRLNATAVPRPTDRRHASTVGFVYFLRAGEHVKIGWSDHPLRRAGELSTAIAGGITSLLMVRGSRNDEKRAHRELKAWHYSGEWYRLAPEVNRFIAAAMAFGRLFPAHRDENKPR